MIQSPDDRRAPISPQLALRVAILGGVALALFGIVFFRLWFLQVLSGDEYVAQARGNRVRNIAIPAQRGQMVDRNGKLLVGSRPASAVIVSPPKLPPEGPARRRLYVRLSHVLQLPTRPEACKVGKRHVRLMEVDCIVQQGVFLLPYADVRIKTDVPPAVYAYLAERTQEFPGVSIEQIYLRSYPHGEVGAQLFGTVGQISEQELRDPHFRGVEGGTLVGKSGLEYAYDHYLRGVDGATRVQVDAFGQAKGRLHRVAPRSGSNLKLSLDLGLEQAGQAALKQGIALANGNGNASTAGAFVALDPRNGEVLAMGSEPSFDPTILTRPISDRRYKDLLGEARSYPQINRAISADYPVGSTFKVVTAAAALATGVITPTTPYTDTGTFTIGAQVRHNAGTASYGTVTLLHAISYSVDTFFYALGQQLNADPTTHPDGGQLQAWARKFGLGKPTGIDLGDEHSGVIPSQRWRDMRDREERRCRRQKHVPACGLSDFRDWTVGDNVSLAVGQGDFLATPLQMAVVYAAIENGGTIVKPHVGLQVTDREGRVLQKIDPKATRHIKIPDIDTIRGGLFAAANESGGTSVDVFTGFPSQYPVYGKTGTASFTNKPDQSWYVAYVPDPVRPIVVACTIESGGFGAQAAAPAVRLILSQWFGVKKQVVTGKSQTLCSSTPIQRSIDDVTRTRGVSRLLLDPWLLLATLGLVICSLVTIKGATRHDITGQPNYFFERQVGYAVVGLLLMGLLARFDYSRLREFKLGVYGLLIGLNLIVLALGSATRGSRRWIELPFFNFQPSEFGKVLLVVALAGFVVDRSRRLGERETTARVMLLALGPAALVMIQPDLGTALVYMALAFAILFVAGAPGRQLGGLMALFAVATVLVLVVAPAVGVHALKPYQVQRLTGFVHPSHDPADQTYQINQSLIAIGSGEKTGRGVEHATQTGLNFLPEHHTDFIFSVVGETYGFAGAALVLSLYALLIWRILRIITLAKNLFGALIAGGILAMLTFQVFVNAGMTIGIMPITGVTLPLMSFGGASYLTTFIALGLLQSIHVHGRIAQGTKGRALILS